MMFMACRLSKKDIADIDALIARANFREPELRLNRSKVFRAAIRAYLDAHAEAPESTAPVIRERRRVIAA
jgi:metal-responsive CopG/Arc/MetJ family transcriptional regulator